MADVEALVIGDNKRPETADGRVGCVMLVASGQSVDDQGNAIKFFDYRPGFFQDIIQVRWDKDTMHVVLPVQVSDYLLRNGYARAMTAQEAQSYNAQLSAEPTAATPAVEPPTVVDEPEADAERPRRKQRKGD
ncbi:hypothetical protein CQ14_06800 [Bradyrhizobium lablabi]|uniref:Uncharacterized protein n=1 Tax=Bradyrhizobium lablabi TaxID=722472 RepID=A0A0R3MM25_9BRAD|nr:hypothetical protein [Bradyrhizobium lablabi]KRR21352.1 hypothetical protein CQ14_06800 [Bradyrhizobium lablabi]